MLAARLEAAEAANGVSMARALKDRLPEVCFESCGAAFAIFAGAGSPMTHVLGLGMNGKVSAEELKRMEAFYQERGSSCFIDLCPLADLSVMAYIESQPYRVVEFNDVLARRISPDEAFNEAGGLRRVQQTEMRQWSRLISEGFSEPMPVSDEMSELIGATCQNAQCWFAGVSADEDALGGGALAIENGVALFFGDSILPGARRRGWQSALIRERLLAAQRQGCGLAMVSVLPGSGSHRNYERAGFELIYTRFNVRRDFSVAGLAEA